MLIAVAGISLWLAWESKYVRDRQQMVAWIEQHGGMMEDPPIYQDAFGRMTRITFWNFPKSRSRSWIRRQMGDVAHIYLQVPEHATREQCEDIARLFPEALVVQKRLGVPED